MSVKETDIEPHKVHTLAPFAVEHRVWVLTLLGAETNSPKTAESGNAPKMAETRQSREGTDLWAAQFRARARPAVS